jgi:hypothetical protein
MKPVNGWLCDPEDVPIHSWMSDAPWFEANLRHGHEHLMPHKDGLSLNCAPLGRVTRKNVKAQLFYGNPVLHPGEMLGLSAMYNTLNPELAQNAVNVLDAGAPNGGTSAWLVGWSLRSAYMATPDGLPLVADGEAALVIADWRYVIRVANIDFNISDIGTVLCKAVQRFPLFGSCRPVIYMNSQAHKKLIEASHALFRDGRFRGVFVRIMDEIRSDEPRVD